MNRKLHIKRRVGADEFTTMINEGRGKIENIFLQGENPQHANMSTTTFVNCGFVGVEMSGFDLSVCTFIDCEFTGVNLEGVQADRLRLLRCKLTGVCLTKARLTNIVIDGGSWSAVDLVEACLDGASLRRQLNLMGVNFDRVSKVAVDIEQSVRMTAVQNLP